MSPTATDVERATAGERRPIRALSPLVASQIAAGEVVERPASVVKELVENALDAGASRIAVELERGGIELIRVRDDGCGLPAEQLALAVAAHATSKITDPEDLDRIATMGFRGEALASIASVSRLSMRSRAAEAPGASEIAGEGDVFAPVRPASGPVGTTVTVRNLFFNTPARRKFLRTPQTEQQRCAEIVRALAMARPAIGFTLTADGRALVDVPAQQGPRDRLLAILGAELESELIEVSADEFDGPGGVALWGLAGLPSISRATTRAQHVFINGRPVNDRTIQHAIKEAYRGLIEPGRHPSVALLLEMDPRSVDVNVHPAKAEVRFRDSGLVHSVTLRSLREALKRADLTPSVASLRPQSYGASAVLPGSGRPAFGEYFARPQGPAAERLDYQTLRSALQPRPAPGTETESRAQGEQIERVEQDAVGFAGEPPAASIEPSPLTGRPRLTSLQVHNSYVVTQDEQGVVIVDQHALHERAMFELLVARIAEAGDLESQRLLVPAPVPMTQAQAEKLEALAPLLKRIGIEAEPLGPRALGVQAFPSFLFERGVEAEEFVRELLEKAERDELVPDSEEALREVLDMMSCKAAVKAGDRLTGEDLEALLALRERVERSSNCPHGRPTSVRLTIRDLERLFGRV
ncbi:MAG: DNA mismatch repair endonuclease MutL [Phycisphaerales bacterium JB039]